MSVTDKAKQSEALAKAIEAAVSAWSPLVGLAISGVKFLIKKMRDNGDITEAEAKPYLEEIARYEKELDKLKATVAEFDRIRAGEKAVAGEQPEGD